MSRLLASLSIEEELEHAEQFVEVPQEHETHESKSHHSSYPAGAHHSREKNAGWSAEHWKERVLNRANES